MLEKIKYKRLTKKLNHHFFGTLLSILQNKMKTEPSNTAFKLPLKKKRQHGPHQTFRMPQVTHGSPTVQQKKELQNRIKEVWCLNPGCCNKIPQSEWLKQQAFISHTSEAESLRSGCQYDQILVRSLFLICRWLSYLQGRGIISPISFLTRALILSRGGPSS